MSTFGAAADAGERPRWRSPTTTSGRSCGMIDESPLDELRIETEGFSLHVRQARRAR